MTSVIKETCNNETCNNETCNNETCNKETCNKETCNKETCNNETCNKETCNNEIKTKLPKTRFSQLFEILLQQKHKMSLFHISLSPDINTFFLLLCKETPEVFDDIETSLKQIILDDKIDIKDIPNIIKLVTNIYRLVNNKKKINKIISQTDPYDMILTLLHLLFVLYMDVHSVKNTELANDLINIIEASIELIKLKDIKVSNCCCFSKLFAR